jgi:hypothetical protein
MVGNVPQAPSSLHPSQSPSTRSLASSDSHPPPPTDNSAMSTTYAYTVAEVWHVWKGCSVTSLGYHHAVWETECFRPRVLQEGKVSEQRTLILKLQWRWHLPSLQCQVSCWRLTSSTTSGLKRVEHWLYLGVGDSRPGLRTIQINSIQINSIQFNSIQFNSIQITLKIASVQIRSIAGLFELSSNNVQINVDSWLHI